MHGDKFAKKLDVVPLSDNTISRRISDMGEDVKCQVIDRVKKSKYALQLDESTDIANCAQLLVLVTVLKENWKKSCLLALRWRVRAQERTFLTNLTTS